MPDPIKHVVLLMMENHSFDQMLGCLQAEYSDLDGVDMNGIPRSNVNSKGDAILQLPTSEQQMAFDPKHENVDVVEQLADGNSGFVKNFEKTYPTSTTEDQQDVMGYYPEDFLPALHQLGKNFTVCDRWFSSLPGPTWPNRFFALSGTSAGCVLMPDGIQHPRLDEFISQEQDTIFQRLTEKGIDWKIYFYDFPISLMLVKQRGLSELSEYRLIEHFFEAASGDEKAFPQFAFIEPKYMAADQNDDHPPHNIFKAEKLIADVYNAIRSNDALWESTLLVVTFDEHGGFYDHVVPPSAVPPDDLRADSTYGFNQLGVRVPAILVSPWVGKRVEHTTFDHTSLLKYLIEKWDLGPLYARTAAATSIQVALRDNMLPSTVLPFIRVPYTDLMPANPDLEKEDLSRHHRAIHALAAFLAKEMGPATGALVQLIAAEAGLVTRLNASIGKLLMRIGGLFSRSLSKQQDDRTWAVVEVAKAHIPDAQSKRT
jgi:phospholipase C